MPSAQSFAWVLEMTTDEINAHAAQIKSAHEQMKAELVEISSDGREVFDWASRLSDRIHRADEIKRVAQQIRNAETQCGGCAYWMTSSCPRETHSNKSGRSTGPSSQAFKCSKFEMTRSTTASLEAARARLETLLMEQEKGGQS